MSSYAGVEIISKNPDLVGENPLWHPEDSKVYWTDNRSLRLYAFNTETRAKETILDGYRVYGFTLQEIGSLLLFMEGTRIGLLEHGSVREVLSGIPDELHNRFNDVIAEPAGSVLFGTVPLGKGSGSLYRIHTNLHLDRLLTGLGLPNGMGFSPDNQSFFLVDTHGASVDRFDYSAQKGALSNRTPFLRFDGEPIHPDGMTVDSDGCIWVALVGGWAIGRWDPSGRLLTRFELPARKITSLSFAGKALETLYITTSSRESVPGEEIGPEGGALFAINPGVKGREEHRSRIVI